ncbi:MAG: choice-of-anchor Y domain-containing protein [Anaerolineales bacterium]
MSPQTTTVLYDGAMNTPPEAQGFVFADLPPGSATRTTANGATTLDTSATNTISAGYTANPSVAPVLDRFAGYSLLFTAQVVTETHANNHRAGFSVTVLSTDTLGIELGFWTDRVWAQEGGSAPNLFTQAEGAALNSAAGLITYTLMVNGDRYSLFEDGQAVLNGALRDYTAFVGPIDPYQTPNLIFLGDNTTSARGSVRFSHVSVIAPLNKTYLPVVLK